MNQRSVFREMLLRRFDYALHRVFIESYLLVISPEQTYKSIFPFYCCVFICYFYYQVYRSHEFFQKSTFHPADWLRLPIK
jgi:hypothetical protein